MRTLLIAVSCVAILLLGAAFSMNAAKKRESVLSSAAGSVRPVVDDWLADLGDALHAATSFLWSDQDEVAKKKGKRTLTSCSFGDGEGPAPERKSYVLTERGYESEPHEADPYGEEEYEEEEPEEY